MTIGDGRAEAGFVSHIPPQLRAMLPANPRPRSPEESLAMLAQIIDMLAQRGPGASNGLTVVQTPDERGLTIRIDLPS
ncbi:hypothetical protein [Mycolicibacterium vaccae]|uniref:hypothetical protein n=1 Tax=Mycolicibacterium vaccae TaxID=1810 RepID=UPI003D03B138